MTIFISLYLLGMQGCKNPRMFSYRHLVLHPMYIADFYFSHIFCCSLVFRPFVAYLQEFMVCNNIISHHHHQAYCFFKHRYFKLCIIFYVFL